MNSFERTAQLQEIKQSLDRLITEMTVLRQQVASLENVMEPMPEQRQRSIKEAEYFGIWVDREDMQRQSSREWLETLRREQWSNL